LMDYKLLLVKYMRHVENSEGVAFLNETDRTDIGLDPLFFTDVQWAELRKLHAQLSALSDDDLMGVE
jgi:hypothetical protein